MQIEGKESNILLLH